MPTSLYDFCEKNNYSPRTVKTIIKERGVPALRVGGKYFFDEVAENAFWEAVRINVPVSEGSRRAAALRPRRA
jgi:uncharacterized protein (UPF0261 family)